MKSFRKNGLSIIFLITLALILSFAGINNPLLPSAEAGFLEEAWGQAGIVAYRAAANTMQSRNPPSQGLDNFQKHYLRRYFSDLLDRVSISYGAKMMDEWVVGNSAVRIGSVESAAQTYCDRIYIRDPYKPRDVIQLIVLAHEMVHVRQCQRFGGLDKFGFNYFREFKRANQVYAKNKLEIEAYAFQDRFTAFL